MERLIRSRRGHHLPTSPTPTFPSNGDANCVKLTASNLVITEDGLAVPNNWGTYTTNSGVPSDSGSGVVVIVSATKYTDTVASVAPGGTAVFTFKRSIN